MPLALKRLDQLSFATKEVLSEINDPQVKHVTSLATSVNPFEQYDLLESDWQEPNDEMLCTPLVSGVVEGVEEVAVGSGVGQMDTITCIGNTDCHKY